MCTILRINYWSFLAPFKNNKTSFSVLKRPYFQVKYVAVGNSCRNVTQKFQISAPRYVTGNLYQSTKTELWSSIGFQHCLARNHNLRRYYLDLCKRDNFVKLFHTTSRNQVPFPPVLWMILKPVAKLISILTGRSIRKWWRSLPPKKRQYLWQRLKENWEKIVVGLGLLVSAGFLNYITHIKETPITGRKRYITFTDEQFKKISDFEFQMHWETYKDKTVGSDHPVYRKVLRITQQLINANQDLQQMEGRGWRVIVVDVPDMNAFVLPTGEIFVFTGILQMIQNDDQLAVVLGHEISHALLSHAAELVSFGQMIDVIVIVIMAAIWAVLPNDGLAVVTQWFYNKVMSLMINLPYSRKLEQEADQVGLQLAAKACFDVRESSNFWNWMALYKLNPEMQELRVPEWLSTHPADEKRAEILDALVPQALELRKQCNCPGLTQDDPRVGMDQMKTWVAMKIKEYEDKGETPVFKASAKGLWPPGKAAEPQVAAAALSDSS